jgi:archaellum component FlaG (FlaF/FlaG flagellin family)
MATINGSSSKKDYGFYIELSNYGGDSSTNKSTVSYKLYIKNNGSRFSGSNYYVRVTINGSNVYATTRDINTTSVGYNEALLLTSGTTTITHNNDGTKTVSVSAEISRSSYTSYDGGYCSLSGSFQLTTIPRYFSKTPTLTLSKGSDEFTLKCE